jgi:hypothetical protein
MIVVFVPALILEIFTIYSSIKFSSLNLPVNPWLILDFSIWNFYLVVPTVYAIFVSSKLTNTAKKMSYYFEKYSNNCQNESTAQKVRV